MEVGKVFSKKLEEGQKFWDAPTKGGKNGIIQEMCILYFG